MGKAAKTWLLAVGTYLLAAAASTLAAQDLPLPVPRTTLYPGDTISADVLSDRLFVERTVTRGSVIESRDALIGKVTKRTLIPGQPIPVNALRDPYTVIQGKPIMLVFKADGLMITSTAVALQNGVTGDHISVRNADSGLVVKGFVQADGTIRVDGQ